MLPARQVRRRSKRQRGVVVEVEQEEDADIEEVTEEGVAEENYGDDILIWMRWT